MRCERNLVFNVTFGCTFTCHNYKGATLRANIRYIITLTTVVAHEVLHTVTNSRQNMWKLLLLLLGIIGLSKKKEEF